MKILGFLKRNVHISKEECTCKQKKCTSKCFLT